MTNACSTRSSFLPARAALPAGIAVILLASVLYYGTYINYGLNTSDDGHYAQVSFELLRGINPHDLRLGYGLMWFKVGQLLFTLAGVSWGAVQAIFFAVITATSVLLYATVVRITRRPALAMLGAAVAIAVPAFPATAFYALCATANVFFQSMMAERWRALTPKDVLAPAAVLSLTFQVRPDFGFIFAVPLLGLLVLGALGSTAGGGTAWSARRFARLALAAVAAVVAVQAPIMLNAARAGYLDLILVEVARYPLTLLRYLQVVLSVAMGASAEEGRQAGTLLARPPLSALWSGGPDSAMAALVYAPVAVVAGFAALTLAGLRRPGGVERLPVRLVVLGGTLATLPHYFLFRPDLAHVANFMPGYLVLVCVLVGDALDAAGRPGRGAGQGMAGRIAAVPLILVPLILLPLGGVALYLQVGLTQPGTGSIAAAAGRTELFTARNGVAVRISPAERPLLEGVRDAIEASSQPGDRIVCVPFCPGMAFMTGRRMLLRDYYVDDSFPLSDPGWIDRSIALIRRERTPVVIVVDWAINGTEISRFQNWARRCIEALEEDGYRRQELPGAVVYHLPRTTP